MKIEKKNGFSENGTADSNIRRQIKRLKDICLVEKVKQGYRIFEYQDLKQIFEKKIKIEILNSIVERNEEFFNFYKKTFEVEK